MPKVIDNLHQQKLMKTSLPSLGKIEDLFEQLKKTDMRAYSAFRSAADFPAP